MANRFLIATNIEIKKFRAERGDGHKYPLDREFQEHLRIFRQSICQKPEYERGKDRARGAAENDNMST